MTNERQFKYVNTEWINQIPIEWEKRKFSKSVKRLSTGLNPRDNFTLNDPGANLYYVTIRNFKDRELYLNDKCDMITQEAWNVIQKRSKLEKGDILFASISEDGQAYLLEEEPTNWNINESVFCIKIDNTVFNSKYFTYLITNQALYKSLRKDATGTTFLSIKQNQLKDCSLVVPPLDEQQSIVNFLDHKISNIDKAISRNNQMIEKLEEYKKSVISRAVTKGLKENIEMKDTQNEWIKEIPANWNVFRIRHLIKNGASGIKVGPFGSALKGKMLGEGEYKVYNQANLIQNDFDFSRHFISTQTFKELSNYEVKPNDILFSVMGTIGKCKVMPTGYPMGIMDSHLIKCRLNDNISPIFFEYVYDKDCSDVVYQQLLYQSQGSIMDGLNSTIIKNLRIPVPPIYEQQQIVNYLDTKCSKIDKSIQQAKEINDKLEEYKKSLIYNAVTGKIDCRKEIVHE